LALWLFEYKKKFYLLMP